MSKLSKTKLAFEELPSVKHKKFLHKLSGYANIPVTSLKKGESMKNKKTTKKSTKKQDLRPVVTLVDVSARSIAVYFLLEPFFMAESQPVRVLMGLAMVWLSLGVAEFIYKRVIVPSAQAITEA